MSEESACGNITLNRATIDVAHSVLEYHQGQAGFDAPEPRPNRNFPDYSAPLPSRAAAATPEALVLSSPAPSTMQKEQAHALSSIRAADAFLTDHADALPTVTSNGTRRHLAELVQELSMHTTDQDGSFIESQSQTQKHRHLREVLIRDHMRAISRISRARLSRVPDFHKLRIPRGNVTAPKLHAAALGMAQAASANAQVFIDAGTSPDFIAELIAAADAMLAAIDNRTLAKGRRRGATDGLKRRLSDARHAVNILDAFVTTALQQDTVLLANWKLIIKVPATPRHAPVDDAPSLALVPPTSSSSHAA